MEMTPQQYQELFTAARTLKARGINTGSVEFPCFVTKDTTHAADRNGCRQRFRRPGKEQPVSLKKLLEREAEGKLCRECVERGYLKEAWSRPELVSLIKGYLNILDLTDALEMGRAADLPDLLEKERVLHRESSALLSGRRTVSEPAFSAAFRKRLDRVLSAFSEEKRTPEGQTAVATLCAEVLFPSVGDLRLDRERTEALTTLVQAQRRLLLDAPEWVVTLVKPGPVDHGSDMTGLVVSAVQTAFGTSGRYPQIDGIEPRLLVMPVVAFELFRKHTVVHTHAWLDTEPPPAFTETLRALYDPSGGAYTTLSSSVAAALAL